MKMVLSDRLRRCTPPAIRLRMTQGWLRMSPGCGCRGAGGANKDSPVASLSRLRPVRQFDLLGYSLRHLCRDHSIKIQDLLFEAEQLAAQRGRACRTTSGTRLSLGSAMTHSSSSMPLRPTGAVTPNSAR